LAGQFGCLAPLRGHPAAIGRLPEVDARCRGECIGADEITQAKRYAIAVTSDERFSSVDGVRWHF